jgi:signal transduction histidine kinase/CheY-like chemotaxis protein/CHASE1-domain containing sensor protein
MTFDWPDRTPLRFRAANVILALVFAAIAAAVTFVGMRAAVESGIKRRLTEESRRIENAIASRLDGAITGLYNARALFLSLPKVDAKTFAEFVEKSEFNHRFPGVRGIGVYEAFDWDGEILSSLMMFEPQDAKSRAALGLDVLEDPARKEVVYRAFRTGGPVLSGMLQRLLPPKTEDEEIMAIYLPMNGGKRGTGPQPGDRWLGIGFKIQDFIQGTFGSPSLHTERVNWQLDAVPRAGDQPSSKIYDRFDPPESDFINRQKLVREIKILGQPFLLTVTPLPTFMSDTDRYLPLLASAVAGALMLIFSLVFHRGRRQLVMETENKEEILSKQNLIAQQSSQLELLNRFSRAVAEEMNEESLLGHFLATIREAKIDFAYLYLSNSSSNPHLKLHSWVGVDDPSGIPEQLSHTFIKQVMSNRFMLTKEHQIMGPSLSRLLGPKAKSEDWIVAVVPTRQRTDQLLLVAGNVSEPFTKLQKELLDNVISHVGLGIDKIALIDGAQTSNRSKSAFLANMSHEIRTPLNALMGFSEMLAGRRLSDARRMNIASSIRKNSEYLTTLIDDVLDLSKIEAGKLKIHHRRVRLASLVHEIKSVIDLKASEKDLKFEVYSNGPLPSHVFVDDVRLKQILLNIIGNAVKFTCNGSVSMSISCRRKSDMSGDLTFYVEDTGVGISDEAQKNLFKPFSQGDDSTTRQFGGSGLGLALSNRLATELGGSLKLIRSIRDVGSVFEITVPTGDIQNVEWVEGLQAPPAPAPVLPWIGTKKLDGVKTLLVEDSVDNQEIFSYFLKNAGAEVVCVDNGKDAVTKGSSGEFDLILMDIQLPGMDGKEATQRLRAQGCRTTIVALTAHAMREEKESCLQAGCDGQITKPVSERDFIAAVYSHLSPEYVSASIGAEMGPLSP